MESGSSDVMNVTVSHTTVLTGTVIRMMVASALGSPAANRPGTTLKQIDETTNEAIIALISDHALMRHQYQRRIRTSPVPAPSARRNFHACSTDESCDVTPIDAMKRRTVAMRPTFT